MSRSASVPPLPARNSYHHGDLRRTLLDAALSEVARNGTAHLSLRALARAVGVSNAAPAHHFKDKSGVFTAIAVEGFELLYATQLRASQGVDASETLLPLAINYVSFAIEHPSHFEVMWRDDLYDATDPALVTVRTSVFAVFYASVASGLGKAAPDEHRGAVVAAWSIVHGFATLWLSGNLSPLLGSEPLTATEEVVRGVVAIAEVAARQLRP
jgi:AcrR family transcriptional regulator